MTEHVMEKAKRALLNAKPANEYTCEYFPYVFVVGESISFTATAALRQLRNYHRGYGVVRVVTLCDVMKVPKGGFKPHVTKADLDQVGEQADTEGNSTFKKKAVNMNYLARKVYEQLLDGKKDVSRAVYYCFPSVREYCMFND